MRLTRGFVLFVALFSAATAAFLVHNAARLSVPAAPPKPELVDILVAARPITVGEMVGKDQVRWLAWPRQTVPAGGIRRDANADPEALPFEPAPARFALLQGEPISPIKLAGPEQGSALAAMLTPGMRAVSVPIREETAAGGFIQPGDRVDVLVTRKRSEAGRDRPRSEVLLRGLKVLAVGKALQGKAPTGRTATLELSPRDAGVLTAAQSTGEIALALIGMDDPARNGVPTASLTGDPSDIRLLKYGRSANRAIPQ
jgi:pilus assembly protein CpaB